MSNKIKITLTELIRRIVNNLPDQETVKIIDTQFFTFGPSDYRHLVRFDWKGTRWLVDTDGDARFLRMEASEEELTSEVITGLLFSEENKVC